MKKQEKQKCIVCGSVRKRNLMVVTNQGVAHIYHAGVEEECLKAVEPLKA